MGDCKMIDFCDRCEKEFDDTELNYHDNGYWSNHPEYEGWCFCDNCEADSEEAELEALIGTNI
jgi:hypothetical protein